MGFQQIVGQERVVRMLRGSLQSGRLSHAYLFSGPPGTGKRKAAHVFAQAVLCTADIDAGDKPCGACVECRKVDNGNHPAVHIIEPDGKHIKLEQIQRLQREFSYRAAAAQHKIYRIEHADRMTSEAANSLLKFLEEPTSNMMAILLSDNAHAVLPTLRSRSLSVPFVPLSPANMVEILVRESLPESLIRPAVHMTSGIEAARELIQLNGFAEMRDIVIILMKECLTRAATASVAIQRHIVKPGLTDQIDTLLDLLALWLKDLLYIQVGRKDRIVYKDQMEWLTKQSFSRDGASWIRCMEHVVRARQRLRTNANPQLILEQCMIHIQEG